MRVTWNANQNNSAADINSEIGLPGRLAIVSCGRILEQRWEWRRKLLKLQTLIQGLNLPVMSMGTFKKDMHYRSI